MQIEVTETRAMDQDTFAAVCDLCSAAYEEDVAAYFTDIGPGVHFLLRDGGILVSHAMLATRLLQPAGERLLQTAYVELVATQPSHQHRGYATHLLRALVPSIAAFELGALSPSDAAFYARLGWELWRGPLSVRTEAGLTPTPDEEVMILRVPRTPATLRLDAALSVEWRSGEVW